VVYIANTRQLPSMARKAPRGDVVAGSCSEDDGRIGRQSGEYRFTADGRCQVIVSHYSLGKGVHLGHTDRVNVLR
jgi:hypothetical protein